MLGTMLTNTFQWVTTLALIILVYLHSFSCCGVPNQRNSERNRTYSSSRSSTFGCQSKAYMQLPISHL